jgi:hypothetical protein
MIAAFVPLLLLTAAVLGLPLLGAVLARQPLEQYLRLPLTERAFDPLPYSDTVFWGNAVLLLALAALVLWAAWPRRDAPPAPAAEDLRRSRAATPFPPWGWAGAASAALAFVLPVGGSALVLIGVTLMASAHTQRRTGSCMLTRRPGFFAALLPAGILVGWLYHWLNLYLQLWYYPEAASRLEFVLARTLEYALLLPALLSIRQWLGSFPRLLDWTGRARHLGPAPLGAGLGWVLIALAGVALVAAPVWPDWIYPLAWVAPLLLATGLQLARGRPTPFAGLVQGDWSRILLPAAAAILVAVIVQLWNEHAGPSRVLTLPLLHGEETPGLPLLAYAGIPPLGLLGLWVADQLARPWHNRPLKRFPKFPFKVVIKP